ncbi:hypothetical protein SAMN04487897_11956 [Paenibacillus sp. yr247]|uniref:hypothetical protein n=1 Tax=Paenibacillus sp. yr247 TaxID=1761880 RepID=UPI00089098DD|nr:hypothetical protein [Paenibacillus sp. yr247]SDO67763.1 hypothetical protein SAMN04487897_11956 [Paenibacillus sp. yr247]
MAANLVNSQSIETNHSPPMLTCVNWNMCRYSSNYAFSVKANSLGNAFSEKTILMLNASSEKHVKSAAKFLKINNLERDLAKSAGNSAISS